MIIWDSDIFRHAVIAAALVGVAAPSIGIYLVQRRLSLMGDGIGHVALTGVAAGLLTQTSPVLVAIVAASLGALAIELLRRRGTAGDVALALIFYGGIAGGVFLVSLSANESIGSLVPYLFGNPFTVTAGDLRVIQVLVVAVLGLTLLLRKELFAVCYDEEMARAQGLPVNALNMLVAVVAAVTIVVTMRIVGILLVAAMLVIPVAAVQQLTGSFKSTLAWSLALGGTVSAGGLVLSVYADLVPAGTIVLSALAAFALCATASRIKGVA